MLCFYCTIFKEKTNENLRMPSVLVRFWLYKHTHDDSFRNYSEIWYELKEDQELK